MSTEIKELVMACDQPTLALAKLLDDGVYLSKPALAMAFAREFDEIPMGLVQSIVLWNRTPNLRRFSAGLSDDVVNRVVNKALLKERFSKVNELNPN